ncbi:hypothetical protein IGS74_04585 [Aureimonas sp. OT7]|uniref:AbiTii domain-containing protein n=1 Tax=Aureimonas sp. OT7 TaxID=2816454 RepID=UPI001786D034|nr:hypothetical protein [Aureimonas sp. OT7]QOG07516.1 hypothetical protein IGS74_04585 [Aureimonas sp. OT7]
MSLLIDIQTAATDGSTSLSTLLRKCRLLASRLESDPLEEWVRWELDGYEPAAEVPAYRKVALSFRGTFSGPFGAQISNAPLPQYLVAKASGQPDVATLSYRSSIATIEGLVEKTGTASINMDNMILLLRDTFYEGYSLVAFSAEFPYSALAGIESAVRNRVLEFAIALWRSEPAAREINVGSVSSPVPPSHVTQIFNGAITGNTNIVAQSDQSKLIALGSVGNITEAIDTLKAAGLDGDTADGFRVAVESDGALVQDTRSYGPAVTSWLGTAIGKAASGAWKVGVGAAGKLTEEVLLRYYGLK